MNWLDILKNIANSGRNAITNLDALHVSTSSHVSGGAVGAIEEKLALFKQDAEDTIAKLASLQPMRTILGELAIGENSVDFDLFETHCNIAFADAENQYDEHDETSTFESLSGFPMSGGDVAQIEHTIVFDALHEEVILYCRSDDVDLFRCSGYFHADSLPGPMETCTISTLLKACNAVGKQYVCDPTNMLIGLASGQSVSLMAVFENIDNAYTTQSIIRDLSTLAIGGNLSFTNVSDLIAKYQNTSSTNVLQLTTMLKTYATSMNTTTVEAILSELISSVTLGTYDDEMGRVIWYENNYHVATSSPTVFWSAIGSIGSAIGLMLANTFKVFGALLFVGGSAIGAAINGISNIIQNATDAYGEINAGANNRLFAVPLKQEQVLKTQFINGFSNALSASEAANILTMAEENGFVNVSAGLYTIIIQNVDDDYLLLSCFLNLGRTSRGLGSLYKDDDNQPVGYVNMFERNALNANGYIGSRSTAPYGTCYGFTRTLGTEGLLIDTTNTYSDDEYDVIDYGLSSGASLANWAKFGLETSQTDAAVRQAITCNIITLATANLSYGQNETSIKAALAAKWSTSTVSFSDWHLFIDSGSALPSSDVDGSPVRLYAWLLSKMPIYTAGTMPLDFALTWDEIVNIAFPALRNITWFGYEHIALKHYNVESVNRISKFFVSPAKISGGALLGALTFGLVAGTVIAATTVVFAVIIRKRAIERMANKVSLCQDYRDLWRSQTNAEDKAYAYKLLKTETFKANLFGKITGVGTYNFTADWFESNNNTVSTNILDAIPLAGLSDEQLNAAADQEAAPTLYEIRNLIKSYPSV